MTHPPFKILICNLETAKRQAFGCDITHIISIIDSSHNPTHHLGNLFEMRNNWRVFVFDDLEDKHRFLTKHKLATTNIIQDILNFTKNLGEQDKILIHCHAGLCRSTAVALLVMLQHGMTEKNALEHLISIRPKAWPNRLVLRLGDALLGTGSVHIVNEWMGKELALRISSEDIF